MDAKRRKMRERKNTIIQESENMHRDTEVPQGAEDKENKKLASCSASLKVNSADVEDHETDFRGCAVSDKQLEIDHVYKLPTLFYLILQR